MDHTLNQDQHFSRLALIFIASNPVIKEEFIQWGAERYKSDLESYFKVLNDYLAGDKSGVMPGAAVHRALNHPHNQRSKRK